MRRLLKKRYSLCGHLCLLVGGTSEEVQSLSATETTHLKMERRTEHILSFHVVEGCHESTYSSMVVVPNDNVKILLLKLPVRKRKFSVKTHHQVPSPAVPIFCSFLVCPKHSMMFFIQVILGLPCSLFPSILPSSNNFWIDFALITCPKYWDFLFFIVDNNELVVIAIYNFFIGCIFRP